MENTRKHFPVLRQYVYANTAAAGLLNEKLLEWRQEHDLDYLIGGSTMKTEAMKNDIPEVRESVARFFGGKSEHTALVPNFSIGLNMLLEGLDKNQKILLVESDYPSVNWPFEYRGYPVSYAKLNANLEQNILEIVRSDDISVLALSLVQWVNGIKIDMDFLKSLKNEYPDLLIIADGTQFCGTTDFNFEDSAIDVLGTSAYKWLLSGYGNGFMMFKDVIKEKISIKTIGFNAANINLNGRDQVRFAKHFEPGHLDTLNFGSLKFSLEYLEKLGKTNIQKHLEKLSQKAKTEFAKLGLLSNEVVKRKTHSTIFNIKGDDAVFQKLTESNIIGSQRGDGIRLSFHFYNTENDIEQIINALETG